MADDDGNGNGTFVERTIGDWTSYQDEDKLVYYHNESTGESTWDAPPGFEDDDDDKLVKADDDADAGGGGEEAGGGGDRVGDDSGPLPDTDETLGRDSDELVGNEDLEDDDGITKSPPIANNEIAAAYSDVNDNEDVDEQQQQQGDDEEIVDGQEIGNGWIAYKDDEGRIYYYNADINETQWDRPTIDDGGGGEGGEVSDGHRTSPHVSGGEEEDNNNIQKGDSSPPTQQEQNVNDDDDSPQKKNQWPSNNQSEQVGDVTKQGKDDQQTQDKDSAITAEQFLQQPDAVMEPNVLDHISSLVQQLGAQVAGPKAMSSLMAGYNGDTSICGVMGLWLAQLKSMGGNSTNSSISTSSSSADNSNNNNDELFLEGVISARTTTEDVINKLAKERFTKDYGDKIMNLSKKEATFIDQMIQSSRWRKLLIDLSALPKNKDSKLFMYCLQSISNLGYHKDIANRMNQSDYFGVFNSMLQSELITAGKIGVDGYSEEVHDSIGDVNNEGGSPMKSLIGDLRRTCTSTSFTYLYAMEVLRELISKSKNKLFEIQNNVNTTSNINHHAESLKAAIRKWERLREELEDEMLKMHTTGTTFQRKRRIDVAITMSDLFQRKRRREVDHTNHVETGGNDGNNGGAISNNNDDNLAKDTLDVALSQLLTKNSLGIPIDKEIADNVLKYAYGGSTDRIGNLLIKHPTAITALLGNLFNPTRRVRQLETRLKCSRLVALAMTASQRLAVKSVRGSSGSDFAANSTVESVDEDVISQVILKASQCCESLENMVSFTVLDSVTNTETSVGRQLSALSIQHAVIAQGVMLWTKELASGSDFVSTASYPTISPCILSLARLVCRYHPLTRPAALEVALIFMTHSNREISHRKMESIKEQCIRLMLWLSTQGLSIDVISALASSEMDSALVRYFFTGILEIVQPPFSLAFVRALGGLMLKKTFVESLQSNHFEEMKKEKIVQLIKIFDETVGGCQQEREGDKALLSTLKSTYAGRV